MTQIYLFKTISILSDAKDNHANIIAYSVMLGVFAILTFVFGYFYFTKRTYDDPKVKMHKKPLSRYYRENRSKIFAGISVTSLVVVFACVTSLAQLLN